MNTSTLSRLILLLACISLPSSSAPAAGWTFAERSNPDGPGKQSLIEHDGKPVAAFIHGDGQFKPYLHVYGAEGELLTNAGLDKDGKASGKFPHHRGIYIGWNQIKSDLGGMEAGTKPFDLWHFNNGGRMEVQKIERLDTGRDSVGFTATIVWRGGKKDTSGSDLLLTETRTHNISRPGGRTQVNAHFVLKAARDLRLDGDLQHAGIHFRASNEVAERAGETVYVWEPDLPGPGGKVPSKELKWCRLQFPIGQRWYAATELNPPGNPVEELSWRDYGRFGFFFKKSMTNGETLALDYRFLIESSEAPAAKAKLSADQASKARTACDADYKAYVKELKR